MSRLPVCTALQRVGAGLSLATPVAIALALWAPNDSARLHLCGAGVVLLLLGQTLQHIGVDIF